MITVISGTNRSDNRTLVFARYFAGLLREMGEETQLLDLGLLEAELLTHDVYAGPADNGQLRQWQQRYVRDAEKFAVFVPEYNGSYPGVLKLFLDGLSVIDYAGNFRKKHIALVGIASGRAGNLRGMDHLADVFAHMGAWVLPNRLPLSQIENLLEDDEVVDPETRTALREHAQQLITA
jgi:NAD(P)H-dependent FMN reductase